MKKVATSVRCVPRCGFDNTEVRTIDLDLVDSDDDLELRGAIEFWFASRGVPDALYDVTFDDNGILAVINDEAFTYEWGTPVV